MSKRGTTFYENAELASTISISYKRRPRFTVQVGSKQTPPQWALESTLMGMTATS
jgi:hypothetical protein